jgi:hypothetical protein
LRTYAILNIKKNKLTLDSKPQVFGDTAWRINTKPTIVVIDPFGPRERNATRLEGAHAVVVDGKIKIDFQSELSKFEGEVRAKKIKNLKQELERVNRPQKITFPNFLSTAIWDKLGGWSSGPFDTIYLKSDKAPALSGRPARTYRIKSIVVGSEEATIEVDGSPEFDNKSKWHIPAGLGGAHDALSYDLGPKKNPTPEWSSTGFVSQGTDHYDGVAFVIDAGEVVGMLRTSTFTSRRNNKLMTAAMPIEFLSSARGNRRYNVKSFFATGGSALFRNYSLAVQDFSTSGPADGEHGSIGDYVTGARFYFDDRVTENKEKPSIRLHYGNVGTSGTPNESGSQGCLVSPLYYVLRQVLVARHLDDFAALNPGAKLPQYRILETAPEKIPNKVPGGAREIFDRSSKSGAKSGEDVVLAKEWQDRIVATLWLIRPDERPLGV